MATRMSNRRKAPTLNAHMDELREHAGQVSEGVRGIATSAGAAALGQLDPVEKYVRDKPVQALLVAAGIGAVCACLFLRR